MPTLGHLLSLQTTQQVQTRPGVNDLFALCPMSTRFWPHVLMSIRLPEFRNPCWDRLSTYRISPVTGTVLRYPLWETPRPSDPDHPSIRLPQPRRRTVIPPYSGPHTPQTKPSPSLHQWPNPDPNSRMTLWRMRTHTTTRPHGPTEICAGVHRRLSSGRPCSYFVFCVVSPWSFSSRKEVVTGRWLLSNCNTNDVFSLRISK